MDNGLIHTLTQFTVYIHVECVNMLCFVLDCENDRTAGKFV